jgi:hypothetical protein
MPSISFSSEFCLGPSRIRQTPCSQSSIGGHSMLLMHDPRRTELGDSHGLFPLYCIVLYLLYDPLLPAFLPSVHSPFRQSISMPHWLCREHLVPGISDQIHNNPFPSIFIPQDIPHLLLNPSNSFPMANLAPDNPHKFPPLFCTAVGNTGRPFGTVGAGNCS